MLMSGSFKKYSDLKNQAQMDNMETGGRAANDVSQLDDASKLDMFMHNVEIMKEDAKTMEKLRKRLNETNEEGKTMQDAAKTKEIRALMDSDIEHVLMLAKSIKKRIEGLEKSSNDTLYGAGSSIDRTRISVIMGFGKKLREIMDEFQGLRAKTAAVYKETVEHKYFSITGEKQYIETIENLASTGKIEEHLMEASHEHGRHQVLHFIEEIQERREGWKYMERNLVELHELFLDMAGLVEAYGQKMGNGGGGGENQMAHWNSFPRPAGVAQLQDQPEDYDNEAKRRATIALIVTVFLVFLIIVPLFVYESQRDME